LSRGPSGKALVVNLSSYSDQEDLIADTSCDEEFARRLFGDLNRDVLRSSRDGNIIILSNSDEEEEQVREEKTVGAEAAPSSTAVNPASTVSSVDADEVPKGVQDHNSGECTPDWDANDGSTDKDEAKLS
jgi:hypothetical protein